jgi:predicted transcriptional regulator
MQTTVTLPADVAARLQRLARACGLPPRDAARMLLTLALRDALREPPAPAGRECDGTRRDAHKEV